MPAPYEIAARLTLTSNASQIFAVLSRDMLGVEGGIKRLEEAFKSLNRTTVALGGALAMAFGGATILAMKKLADKGAELTNEFAKMKNLGMSDTDLARMKSAAAGMHSQVPGATTLDATKILNTTYSLFGADNAIKMLKPLLEFEQLLGATTGNYKQAEEKILSMVRAGDLMGKFVDTVTHQVDITKLQHFLDLGSKVQQATHGRVSASQWLALAQQGGPALSNMTDEGLVTMGMVTQAMGGHRAGTALASLFSQFKGGIMTKWRAQELQKLGLLPEDAIQEVTPGGHIVWKEGALRTPFAQALGRDPMQAVAMMSAAMTSKGITDPEKQIEEIFKIFQRQTSVREIHDIFRNMPQMAQERERILGAAGTGQALGTLNAESYERNIHLLDAAWQTLLQHVGGPIAQVAIPVLQNLTSVIDKLTAAAQAHPGVITALATGITALGAALATAGAGALIAAIGPAGWFIGGVTALVAIHWDAIKDGISYLDQLATALAGKLEGALKGAADAVNAFADFLVGIGKKIYNFITTLGGLLNKTSFGGGGGFGGGGLGGEGGYGAITKASYSTGEVADYIRQSAVAHGIDPNVALAVFKQESGFNPNAVGDGGRSFGVAQLYTGGGEGNRFRAMGGSLAPGAWRSQVDYALGRVATQGWGHWHGARDVGIGQWQGVHPNWHRSSTVKPYHGGSHGGANIVADVYLDGKQITSAAVGHIMKASALQTQASHFDGLGMYNGPAAQLNTA